MALRKPLVQNGGSFEELPATDMLNVDAAAVFNDAGAVVDCRIEGDSLTHMRVKRNAGGAVLGQS